MKAYFTIPETALEACVVSKETIKSYLDWHKLAITICSAAIGSMFLRFGGTKEIPAAFSISTGLFIVSMVLLFLSYISVVDSKSTQPTLRNYQNKTLGSYSPTLQCSAEHTYTLSRSTKKKIWIRLVCFHVRIYCDGNWNNHPSGQRSVCNFIYELTPLRRCIMLAFYGLNSRFGI